MKVLVLSAAIVVFACSIAVGALTQNSTRTGAAFEVVSVKPSPPAATVGPTLASPCAAGPVQIDPRRFVAGGVTALRLIAWAYGIRDCRPELGLVSGGPTWIRSELFNVEAVLPEGAPSYSRQQLTNGEAPNLQAMLQLLLMDRFKLTVRRETAEMRVLNLVVSKPGKMQPSNDQNSAGGPPPGTLLMNNGVLQGTSIPMSLLMVVLQARVDRPLMDKTDLTALYDIRISVEVEPSTLVLTPEAIAQVVDGLGLKLESGRAPMQVLVIDRVEKPTEN
jgi:uncharacterized protein (TIGR03435 family)